MARALIGEEKRAAVPLMPPESVLSDAHWVSPSMRSRNNAKKLFSGIEIVRPSARCEDIHFAGFRALTLADEGDRK